MCACFFFACLMQTLYILKGHSQQLICYIFRPSYFYFAYLCVYVRSICVLGSNSIHLSLSSDMAQKKLVNACKICNANVYDVCVCVHLCRLLILQFIFVVSVLLLFIEPGKWFMLIIHARTHSTAHWMPHRIWLNLYKLSFYKILWEMLWWQERQQSSNSPTRKNK